MLKPYILNGTPLTTREMMEISHHYEVASTQEVILENPNMFGDLTEDEAWTIAENARELWSDYYYSGDNELETLFEAMKKLGFKIPEDNYSDT